MMESDTHCIRHLRFRGPLENPRLARHRVETALADGAGSPRLGKETILCVRRLAIPLRRVEKLKDELEAEASAAARPARGPVPANANAVLFADRAELLACLARDWCAGNATTLWWWPVLFPRDDFGVVVRRAWLKDAQPLPAALTRLESAGLAAEFLTKLSPVDVAALWRNIVNTFHLAALDVSWSAINIMQADPSAVRPPHDAAPWSPWISPDSTLNMDAARVLITAILLERAPARIRSVSFAREVRRWCHPSGIHHAPELASNKIIPSSEDASKSELQQSVPVPPSGDRITPVGQTLVEPSAGQAPSPRGQRQRRTGSRTHTDRSKRARATKGNPITSPEAPTDGGSPDAITMGTDSPASPRARGDRSRLVHFKKRDPLNSPATATDTNIAVPPAASRDVIATEWGGSFYLVNVAIALGLYGDFTTPAQTGLALPLWDFLALVAGRFIGKEFSEDPLPGLFARLSGRAEDESPAAEFEPPTGEPLPVWLDRTCHAFQERLAAALGPTREWDLRTFVLNQQAKIVTDSTRLDAYFSLARHPIELRLAGLDRDPGWVPAGGRSIHFHYD